jgi:hypothetical protein
MVKRKRMVKPCVLSTKKKPVVTTTAVKKEDVVRQNKVDGTIVKINLTKILDTLKNCLCVHQNATRGAGNRGIPHCKEVGTKLINALQAGIEIERSYITKLFTFIFKRGVWGHRRCSNHASISLTPIITTLLLHYIPSEAVITKLSSYSAYFDCLKSLKDSKNPGNPQNAKFTGFTEKFFLGILKYDAEKCGSVVEADCNADHVSRLKYVFDNCTLTPDVVTFLFKCRCPHVIKKCLEIIKDQTVDKSLITRDCLSNACILLPEQTGKNYIGELVKNRDFNINEQCLEIVSEWCDEEAILYILSYKIPVKKIHFQKVIQSKGFIKTRQRYGRNIPVNRYKNGGYTPLKVELLFNAGYRMDLEDVKFSIEQKKVIPDIERFGLELDDNIYKTCHQHKFYPAYKFTLENPQLSELQKLCNKSKNIDKIKKYTEDNKLTPDKACMEYALTHKANYRVLNYFHSKGLKFNTNPIRTAIVVGQRYRIPWRSNRRGRRYRRGRKLKKSQMPTITVKDAREITVNCLAKDYVDDINSYKKKIKELSDKLGKYEMVEDLSSFKLDDLEDFDYNEPTMIEEELKVKISKIKKVIKKKVPTTITKTKRSVTRSIKHSKSQLQPTLEDKITEKIDLSDDIDLDDFDIDAIETIEGDKIIVVKGKNPTKKDTSIIPSSLEIELGIILD